LPLDPSRLCKILRNPMPPWTPTLPQRMMCATTAAEKSRGAIC
jgi:hypothetical protein